MDPIWEQINGAPMMGHFILALYFAFAIFAARFILDRFIFRFFILSVVGAVIVSFCSGELGSQVISSPYRLSMWLSCCGTSLLKIDETKRAKCAESLWKFTYFATVEIVTLASIYREPFFRDVKELSRNWPNHELKHSLKLIYMCQCGFYIYSIVALVTWETRRKDFSVSISHHIVTMILIAGSYIFRVFRVGAMMLVLHDASDVFLEAAKVFKYSEKEVGASFCFGLFALSWILLRLVYFPFWIIRETSYHSCKMVNLSVPFYMTLYYVFNTMLLMLLVFHIYWWKLICAMITRQLKSRGKVGEDIRSDSEDD